MLGPMSASSSLVSFSLKSMSFSKSSHPPEQLNFHPCLCCHPFFQGPNLLCFDYYRSSPTNHWQRKVLLNLQFERYLILCHFLKLFGNIFGKNI